MKRMLSLLLALVFVLTLQPVTARAVETFAISEAGIAMIKRYEGFRDLPYTDNGSDWYIGYGTSCDPAAHPFPIGEAEADLLLRQALASKEERVNRLLQEYSITVNQQQFDALTSMTYNLGQQWINPSYRLCSYLINGIWNYTETEVVNAIATWCHSGTTVLEHVASRRLEEAFLFLYGQYENDGASRYTYIHFDPNGGEVENQTVFYPVGSIYGQLPVPDGGGRSFLGWYTEEGLQLTGQEMALEDINVTAVWDGEGGGALPRPQEPELDLSTWVNPYGDVKETDWYFSYVRELSAKGIVNGYAEDGTFRAGETLTAGQALKLILLAAGYGEQAPVTHHWASGYLELAERMGFLRPGESWALDEPISRMNIAYLSAKALGLVERQGAAPFEDTESGYLLALYEEEILEGTIIGGKRYYYPDSFINRAEICAIVSRINSWEPRVENDPASSGYVLYRDKFYPVQQYMPVCPYDRNLFVLDGSTMYYNDPAYRTAIGIDVSNYQGEIDWQKVAASGVEFAFIRLGFRGYSEGKLNQDQRFLENLAGAKAAGVKVGVYFFSQAVNTAEAMEEANFVLEALAGVPLEYPVVFDWETISGDAARTDGLDSTTLTDCAITFCEMVARFGYTPMIYYNSPVGYGKYELNRLAQYDIWYAQYAEKPGMYYNYRVWQYTDSGKVDGIEGRVDMNIAFLPY